MTEQKNHQLLYRWFNLCSCLSNQINCSPCCFRNSNICNRCRCVRLYVRRYCRQVHRSACFWLLHLRHPFRSSAFLCAVRCVLSQECCSRLMHPSPLLHLTLVYGRRWLVFLRPILRCPGFALRVYPVHEPGHFCLNIHKPMNGR